MENVYPQKMKGMAFQIPEGLHMYSRLDSRKNTTPRGVEQLSAPWHFYKHLMPLASEKTGNDLPETKVQPSLLADRCNETLNVAA